MVRDSAIFIAQNTLYPKKEILYEDCLKKWCNEKSRKHYSQQISKRDSTESSSKRSLHYIIILHLAFFSPVLLLDPYFHLKKYVRTGS